MNIICIEWEEDPIPSDNIKYSQEMGEQTVRYILGDRRSATNMAEEPGTDKNTVCPWARDHRRAHSLPGWIVLVYGQ